MTRNMKKISVASKIGILPILQEFPTTTTRLESHAPSALLEPLAEPQISSVLKAARSYGLTIVNNLP